MPSILGTHDTGIRSVAASLILDRANLLILRQTVEGFELRDSAGVEVIHCEDWPHVERVLLRLKVPFHKIDEIAGLIQPGTEISLHRAVGK
jgi:hypothetical protein